MKKLLYTYFILFIVAFAFLLRVYHVESNPPSLTWDEVSIGYNAYSILKTGKDEHGRFLPPDTFVGYGDYKPPLPVYLTVPFVAVFGLNELAVRLPSALFGTLTVLLTYFLVNALFSLSKTKDLRPTTLPLLSAFLLAISPWHINLSRAGFEANIALFFIVSGVLLTLKALKYPKMWMVVWIPFVTAMYTFNSSRYFAPLLGTGLLVIGWKSIKKNIGFFFIGAGISVFLLLPLIPHLVSKEARLRYIEVNIFSDPQIVVTSNTRIKEAGNAWWAKIVFNRRIGYARSYALHFLDHFQPDYLFIKGDGNPKFSIRDVGQLYTIEAPLLVIGIFTMLVVDTRIALFLLFWILMAIVPAAVVRETPHALRTLNSLPTWQIFTAFGIVSIINWIKIREQRTDNKKNVSMTYDLRSTTMSMTFCTLLSVLYVVSVSYYLHTYYVHYPKEFSHEWQYGYKQALDFIRPLEKNYDTIYVTDFIGRPYMYALFYDKTDPNEFFRTKDAFFDASGFYHVNGFGKYRFVIDMPTQCTGSCLFVGPAGSEGSETKVLHTVRLLNGSPVLTIYQK